MDSEESIRAELRRMRMAGSCSSMARIADAAAVIATCVAELTIALIAAIGENVSTEPEN